MFKFTFQTRFVDVKRIWATFVGFLKIQDGGQKEIMRGQFIFRFTVLSLLPCIFVLSLNISGLSWWTNLYFDLQSESYRFILAIMHFYVKIRHVSAVPLQWAWAISPNFRVSTDGLNSVCHTKCHSGNTFLFLLSLNFSSCVDLQFLRKFSNDTQYNYIHLDQDLAGDHPWWIITLHLNCEDIVRRKYKQRSQQNIHIFFFENINLDIFFFLLIFFFSRIYGNQEPIIWWAPAEINNKKYTPFYLSCIRLAQFFLIWPSINTSIL